MAENKNNFLITCPLYTPSTTVVTADLMLLHNKHTWMLLVHMYHNFAYTLPWNQNHWWHRGDRKKVEEGEKAYTYSWDAGTEKK